MTGTHLYSSVSFHTAAALADEPAASETNGNGTPGTLTITPDDWKKLPRTRLHVQVKGQPAEELTF